MVIGTSIGSYRILAKLGEGGMGEVYRAVDTRLGRDVAIKRLPMAFASDPERLARFEREARLLAALNHPGIAHLYGFEGAVLEDGTTTHVLVMELVEGEDLAERLARGPVPIEEAIPIAHQIADALEAAHEKGIVHRDLKPANVKLTPEGTVKVLDFGLAKAWSAIDDARTGSAPAVSQSPTAVYSGTAVGLVLGTAAYMAPEQARGKPVDKRADIWAFGVVLYEMLTGRRLFEGETVSDVLAAVLTREPDWSALPPRLPAGLRRLLRRCLERDRRHRLHSAADARLEIDEALANTEAAVVATQEPKSRGAGRLPWIVAGLLAIALAATLARSLYLPEPPVVTTRVKVELAPGEPLSSLFGANAVLSPDGRTIALVTGPEGSTRLSVRRLDGLATTLLEGTNGARAPFFSPDGRWIGFSSLIGLLKVGVAGGAPIKICDIGTNLGRGATWSGDVIVFAGGWDTGLSRVAATGGRPEPLTRLDRAHDERSHRWPSFLPGGQAVLFMAQRSGGDYDDANIEAVSLADGRRSVLVRGGAFPRYAAPGRLLFVRGGVLYALGFNPDTLRVAEPATPVVEGLLAWTGDQESGDGSAEYSLSAQGDLLYRASDVHAAAAGTRFAWVDADARETPAFELDVRVLGFEVSPDGRRVAIEGRSARGRGIFLRDLDQGSLVPLTSEGAGESRPVWSPDGRRLAFTSRGAGEARVVSIITLDGSRPELRVPPAAASSGPTSWMRDGSALVVGDWRPETLDDVWLLPLDGRKPRPLVDSPRFDGGGRVSPNGRWLAYYGEEKGPGQVFVTPLPGPGPRWQVSARRGSMPRWSRDGRLLYFVQSGTEFDQALESELLAVPVDDSGAEPRFGEPRMVFRGFLQGPPERPIFDTHPDGRLLVIRRSAQDAGLDRSHAVLVLGWQGELGRRMRDAVTTP